MTTETILVKRRALHRGEIGLFPNNPMAEEDLGYVSMDDEVVCRLSSPKNVELLKFLWAIVHKAADNSDMFVDKDDAMEQLKLRVSFSKWVYDDKTRKVERRTKSLKQISNENLRRLTDQIIEVICAEIIPGMPQNKLRKEVEEMLKPRQRRANQ